MDGNDNMFNDKMFKLGVIWFKGYIYIYSAYLTLLQRSWNSASNALERMARFAFRTMRSRTGLLVIDIDVLDFGWRLVYIMWWSKDLIYAITENYYAYLYYCIVMLP